ncbi:MAG: serine/threonine protein kinase [Phycisphaerales bacterium]|nr:serine/threonine protein kinase [Phycisphaerales bacterium]
MTLVLPNLPYKIERELGRGGMGVVYLARDTRLGRQVAIKTLPPAAGDHSAPDQHRRTERFRREAQILAQLNHPNIAGIYDIAEDRGAVYLVMEYVDGPTLMDRLSQQPGGLPANEAISVAEAIATALTAAHEAGIVHGDLKPANVKITPKGIVKILDFGLARGGSRQNTLDVSVTDDAPTSAFAASDIDSLVAGTPGYMSPEMARGQTVDARADLFALGSVFFETLTGRRAFSGKTAGEVMASVLLHEPDYTQIRAGTPDAAARLIARMVAKDPAKRPSTAAEVVQALQLMRSRGGGGTASIPPVSAQASIAVESLPEEDSVNPADAISLIDLSPGSTPPSRYLSQLPAQAREALIMCAAMSGGFTQATATAVCGASSGNAVQQIIQWGLLTREMVPGGGARLFMPEALRLSIQQQHRRSEPLQLANQRLLGHLATWSETIRTLLDSPAQAGCLRDVDAEIDLIAGAIGWSAATDECHQQAVMLLSNLRPYWEIRGRVGYARTSLEKAFDRGHNRLSPATQAAGLSASGTLAYHEGDMFEAVALQRKALNQSRKLGDETGTADCLLLLASALILKEPLTARNMLQEAIDLGNKLDRRDFVARGCLGLGFLSLYTASMIDAQRALLAAAALRTATQGQLAPRLSGQIQGMWAYLKLLQLELPEAERLAREQLALHEQIEDQPGMGATRCMLAKIHLSAKNIGDGEEELEKGLSILRTVRDKVELIQGLAVKAHLLSERGQHAQALTLWLALERHRAELMLPVSPAERLLAQRWMLHSVQAVGDAGFKQAEKDALSLTWLRMNE